MPKNKIAIENLSATNPNIGAKTAINDAFIWLSIDSTVTLWLLSIISPMASTNKGRLESFSKYTIKYSMIII